MILQLTDYAITVLASTPSPVLEVFKIGNAFNYVPVSTDTDIHGTVLFTGQIAPPLVLNANVVKYTISMGNSVGDFDWGEVGFFHQGQLFALGVSNTLEHKFKVGMQSGNQVRLDAFLTLVGTNYNMIVDQADSANQFQMATLSTVDQLPPSNQTGPNAYVVSAATAAQSSFLAYTDRTGLWNFDAYQYATASRAVVTARDSQSVTIASSDFTPDMNPAYFGATALEFVTGPLYSICRYVKTAVQSGGSVVLGFDTPLAMLPNVGDTVSIFVRLKQSASIPLPIASASILGAIKIGSGLKIDPLTGVCSLDTATINAVTKVNGKGPGVVTLLAADIPDLATVAKTGSYNDLLDKPALYVLPVANTATLGGVRAPTNGNLTINAQGVIDFGSPLVKTVNNVAPDAQGNVNVTANVIGLVNPTAVAASADLNSLTTTGLFTVSAAVTPTLSHAPTASGQATLEIVPFTTTGTGDVVQRWSNDISMYWRARFGGVWGGWNAVSTAVPATTSSLGIVQIGAGLSVTPQGVLSTDAAALPKATTASLGVVQVGSGLKVTAGGLLSWDTASVPIATATVPGIIKVGGGLAIDGAGVLSATASAYVLPNASATLLGGVKVGSGLSIDGAGVLTAAATPYILPVATTAALGGVRIGNGISVDGSGLIASKILTVNGASPDVAGNVTVTSDSNKLDKVNGVATGLFLSFLDQGTKAAGSTMTVNAALGNVQRAAFTGGAITWAFTWPNAGTYAEVQVELQNAGLATHAFGSVLWYNQDGSTSNFATYIANKRTGATNFQSAGTDFALFWSRDGGATMYAIIL